MTTAQMQLLVKIAKAQGYCDAIIKSSGECGPTKCAEMILTEFNEVAAGIRGCTFDGETNAD
jgi:hypothetical protein